MVRFFPARLKTAHALCLILGMGLAVRAVFLFFHPTRILPLHMGRCGPEPRLKPLHQPPDDPSLAFLARETWPKSGRRSTINGSRPSILQPPCCFSGRWPGSARPVFLQSCFLLLDIGLWWSWRLSCDSSTAGFTAFVLRANPLVIVFISGRHLDVLQVFFLCLGYSCWSRIHCGGCLCIGFAVMAKYLSATVTPSAGGAMRGGEPWRSSARGAFHSLSGDRPGSFRSCSNSGPGCTTMTSSRKYWIDIRSGGLRRLPSIGLCLGWIWLSEDDLLRGFYFASAACWCFCRRCILVLVMIAPFMCFFPSRAWLYLQIAVLFTFPVLGHEFRTGVFQEISWLKLPSICRSSVCWPGSFSKRRSGGRRPIVSLQYLGDHPTLNEAANIGGFCQTCGIAMDSGNHCIGRRLRDDTVAVAKALVHG